MRVLLSVLAYAYVLKFLFMYTVLRYVLKFANHILITFGCLMEPKLVLKSESSDIQKNLVISYSGVQLESSHEWNFVTVQQLNATA